MQSQRRFKRMIIESLGDRILIHIGTMEIWDGADLALLRDGLMHLIERDHERAILIDLSFVKYIPSGFFGMLYDWYEKRRVRFWLTEPQPNVAQMIWFQKFFRKSAEGWYELVPGGVDKAVSSTANQACTVTTELSS